jgi:hypothetical protein
MFKLLCVAYLSLLVGLTIGSVGEMPKNVDTPFDNSLPIIVFLTYGVIGLLGYLAGREDG